MALFKQHIRVSGMIKAGTPIELDAGGKLKSDLPLAFELESSFVAKKLIDKIGITNELNETKLNLEIAAKESAENIVKEDPANSGRFVYDTKYSGIAKICAARYAALKKLERRLFIEIGGRYDEMTSAGITDSDARSVITDEANAIYKSTMYYINKSFPLPKNLADNIMKNKVKQISYDD